MTTTDLKFFLPNYTDSGAFLVDKSNRLYFQLPNLFCHHSVMYHRIMAKSMPHAAFNDPNM